MANRDPAINEFYDILKQCEAKGVDEDIRKKIKDAIILAEARNEYCANMSTEPSDVLKTIQKETVEYPFGLAFTMGYAAMACAEAIPEDGTVVTCEFDPFLARIAKDFFAKSPHGKKITIKVGPAQETLLKLVEEKAEFDFVFIDAEKDGYIEYFKTVIDKGLLAKRGTIALDNALSRGNVYTKDSTSIAIRKCNEYIQSRNDVVQVLVPIRDGVMVVRREEDVYY